MAKLLLKRKHTEWDKINEKECMEVAAETMSLPEKCFFSQLSDYWLFYSIGFPCHYIQINHKLRVTHFDEHIFWMKQHTESNQLKQIKFETVTFNLINYVWLSKPSLGLINCKYVF